MKIQPNTLANMAVRATTDTPAQRHRADASGKTFDHTLRTMRQAMDLAMADRFLAAATRWDENQKDNESLGGMSANQLGMSMLTSLSALGMPGSTPNISAVRNAYGLPSEVRSRGAATGAGLENGLGGQNRDASGLADQVLGMLSRRFESGTLGSEAIGYDRVGGTSYGTYQLSSTQGSLNGFLDFLATRAPELAKRLQAAGPANTGSTEGALPAEWQAIAKEYPQLFSQLQSSFIELSHFEPALQAVARATGLDVRNLPQAMNEVLFSTAVQHGPSGAASIFSQALDGLNLEALGQDGGGLDMNALGQFIENIYNARATRFGSSTPEVQAAVGNRMRNEKSLALALLNQTPFSSLA